MNKKNKGIMKVLCCYCH